MPHGNVDSEKATAQNAATEPAQPNDQARGEQASAHPEPRSYVAHDVRDASLAAPAAGEVGDYGDLGDADDAAMPGGQQGRTNGNREAHAHTEGQGPKTLKANRENAKSGSPDQGTQ